MLTFKSPFTMIIVGATSSGKTQWVKKFIENSQKLLAPPPRHILYCYSEINNVVLALKNKGVEIFQGVPSKELIAEKAKPLLLIIDDLMLNMDTNYLDLLFTRGSHNWDVNVVFITQALYGKNIRTARANSHYIVLMRNPQAKQNIRTLGIQLFPGKLKYFMEAYEDATSKLYSYLVIDTHPNTPDAERLSTKIFPTERTIFYLPI